MVVDVPLEVLRHVGEVLLLDVASLLCQILFFGMDPPVVYIPSVETSNHIVQEYMPF